MKFRTLTMAFAAAAALASGPSFAADSVEVQYHDLDLTSANGKQVLQSRIEAAAKTVCGVNDLRTGTRLSSSDARKCYKQALADINEQFALVIDKADRGG